jgi:hypothetical protein
MRANSLAEFMACVFQTQEMEHQRFSTYRILFSIAGFRPHMDKMRHVRNTLHSIRNLQWMFNERKINHVKLQLNASSAIVYLYYHADAPK